MASKYASLRGKIPVAERTARAQGIVDAIKARKGKPLAELCLEYNTNVAKVAKIAAEAAAMKAVQDALEIMIREHLDEGGMDGARIDGYAWTPTCEPYPVADDVDKVMEYFRKSDPDKLKLSPSEIASRLKAHVKQEALDGEFEVVEKEVVDEATGETKTVQEVRSKIPGVKIFLKEDLSRQKSTKKGE